MCLVISTVFIQRNHVKVQAAVRSVWVSSLNVMGKKNKKKNEQSADALGKSHKVNLNVAKMAEIVIQRMLLSQACFTGLTLKATNAVKQRFYKDVNQAAVF